VNVAKEMLKIGDTARAVEILDMCQECVPEENYPLDMTYLGFSNEYMVIDMIETYYKAGASEKALELSEKFIDQLFASTEFFLEYYDFAKREFEACYNCISYVADLSDHFGSKDYASEIRDRFNSLLDLGE
jgi:regulator of sigma D